MSIKHQETLFAGIGQSPGCDPKSSKRSSGLFSFFKWFRPSASRESISQELTPTSSCDSLNSITSTGTIASFSFVSPSEYKASVPEKSIALGPETDTYRARLKQRDKRRENDKDLTLRKKYNLFFNRDTLLKSKKNLKTDNSKSLPLMTRKTMELEEDKAHRRANSESSKLKKAGAYCHVKGKRKAPPPPVNKSISEGNSTLSLRRKKRLAPKPPATVIPEKIINCLENADKYGTIEYVDVDIVANDSLKLDHGILKSTKEYNDTQKSIEANKSPRASYIEPPVSPRPWYKRNLSRDSGSIFKKEKDATKSENKYEAINCFSEVQYNKNSNASELNVEESKSAKKKQDKRKSGIAFLTNISELDREASEIIKNEHKNDNTEMDPPPFMRPRAEPEKSNTDSWISPKRRSARDLIAKFNAITNVTKVTVNSAFFGSKESSAFQKEHLKRDYFGEQTGINEEPSKQIKTDVLKIPIKKTEHSKSVSPDENKKHLLMKSESAIITSDKDYNKKTLKIDKRSWYCPKCSLENDYWRIICYVCSTIKPYFDDLSSPPVKNTTPEKNLTPTPEIKQFPSSSTSDDSNHAKHQNEIPFFEKHLERSKTQIGFSALEKYNQKQEKKSISIVEPPKLSPTDKNEERERLKKMLIEMKNSLPNRRGMSSRGKIEEVNTEPLQTNWSKNDNKTTPKIEQENEKGITQQKEKIAELLIKTTETIYENIKVKKTENPKPIKISSSAQTNALARKHDIISPSKSIEKQEVNKNFQLMRPKDFANIYNEKTEKPDQHIYANLLENSDLFVNMPVKFSEIKNTVANNTDTLEINRLLKRLETAIARGELSEASNLARELALLKINCCVVRQKSIPDDEDKKTGFSVNMYVEDKISHRGPFPIVVSENQTVKQLKVQVENEFQIPAMVQRWILGKQLATDDNACLNDFQLTAEGCSIFLYLVAPINDNKVEKTNKQDVINTDIQNQSTIIEQSNSDRSNQETSKEQNFTKTESTGATTSKQINYPDIKETAASTSYINKTEFLKDFLKLTPKQTTDEEVDDYDSSTLKPKWECIMCTFLNSQDTNVCAICSTIRKLKMPNVDNQDKPKEAEILETDNKKDEHYLQLLNLDNADLVENTKIFECLICLTEIQPHEGVVLRECLHQFCKPCLSYTIEFTDEAEVKCPYRDNDYSCDISLQDREIKALVTPVLYEQFLAKSVAQAENKIDKSFHCKTPDCPGWCIFEDNVNEFKCPVCQKTNCLTCQAIHAGLNCKQYQEQINDSIADEGTRRTKEMLEDMVNKGEAIKCPTCQVILMKKWGCDWLRCSMCKTEICWVTRGPRWGPAGKGDTSGGCQCGVNGIKCHPQCNYCH